MVTFQTRVIQILEQARIAYRLLPHDEPAYTIKAAAQQRGIVEEEMIKSILLREQHGRYVMACITGNSRLNPRSVRAHLGEGWKRLVFASADEILEVTGFRMGAVAPVGISPEIPVVFDIAIAKLGRVSISSGDPMAGLELDSQDLIRISNARFAPIAE